LGTAVAAASATEFRRTRSHGGYRCLIVKPAPRWRLSASGPGIRHRPFMATRQSVRRSSSRAATGTASAKPDHAGAAHERRTRGRHRRGRVLP
jgi:hypothetical protein